MSIEQQNKEMAKALSNTADLVVRFKEAKELIKSQAEEIERLTKELNELKNK